MENLSTPTVSLFLDTRTVKNVGKDKGRSPLKLRVTYESKNNRSWNIGFSFTEQEYDRLNKNFRKDPYKDIWLAIDAKVKNFSPHLMALRRKSSLTAKRTIYKFIFLDLSHLVEKNILTL